MPRFRITKTVFCLSVLAVLGATAYTLESHFKPQQSLADAQPHVDILNVSPFAQVKTQAEILGAASALLVLADGRVAKPELAFMHDIIASGTSLTTGQGEYDVTSEVLASVDRVRWMMTFERCLEAFKLGSRQTPPFTSADYIAFHELLDKRIKRLEDPAGSYLILLAMAKIWSTKDFTDGTVDQVMAATLERDRAVFFFRTLRKSYKQSYQTQLPQKTNQQSVVLALSKPAEGIEQ